ncbi:aldo/keto reductase [Synechococcales cyanobacterium C]|uniref:Aldo/keto reductase n=1 Tax=Petrachloros mirabilis ULC683 TaxID=2781853 RepID=A0A8K1ZZ37_9CYAN|nr:aldo/keto reductase [Petrachloros mirabilis]NCJ06733.1 aldo/keto reductase [Petrachloros mirabilis ULC683]
MQYRRFGQTGLSLSVFSLGTMRYLADPEMAYNTLVRAVELGVNHLETAQGYGNSEIYLGQALQRGLPRSREQLVVATKIAPQPDAQSMQAAIQRSLERLGVSYIDCLGIHGLNTWEHLQWITDPQGCMVAVRAAIAAQQVRHVGFSTHGSLELILAAIQTHFFEFVNLHYTLLFQHNAPAVALAATKDMGVFIISPADKGGNLYTPPPTLAKLCAPLDPLHLNARFLLSQPSITTLSVGPACPEELDWPLAVADQTEPLTQNEQVILERLAQHQVQALGSDLCEQCYQCLPCPEDIHIPEVLRLRNLAVAYGMTEFGRYRYRMFENAGHWFPGRKGNHCTDCGDCLPKCPVSLPIPDLLRDSHERFQGAPRPRLWESI